MGFSTPLAAHKEGELGLRFLSTYLNPIRSALVGLFEQFGRHIRPQLEDNEVSRSQPPST